MAQIPLETTKSLGLKLMQGLTEDIDGFFTLDTKKGVNIRIQFVPNVPLPKINLATLSAAEAQST
jgi:two-component sensor histidine kinase